MFYFSTDSLDDGCCGDNPIFDSRYWYSIEWGQERIDNYIIEKGFSVPVTVFEYTYIQPYFRPKNSNHKDQHILEGVPNGVIHIESSPKLVCGDMNLFGHISDEDSWKEGEDFDFVIDDETYKKRLEDFIGRMVDRELYEEAAKAKKRLDRLNS